MQCNLMKFWNDPVLEERARELSKGLRCLVCQNESIDDSDAALARDLRLLVRERWLQVTVMKKCWTFVVERYGEFALLQPKFGGSNLVLWIAGPLGLLVRAFHWFEHDAAILLQILRRKTS
jgi:cytochrome c-type biogenesis protein CcmH